MMQSMVAIVFILMITSVCIKSSYKKSESGGTLISRETTTALKGVAILYVFVHHYWQLTSDVYNSHTVIGYIGVTIFLLIAGYVSQIQLKKKGIISMSYNFFIKKFVRLYIPYICVKAILSLWQQKSLHDFIASVIHIEDDWFLCTITILYCLFFLTSRISRGKQNHVMLVGIILYVIVCMTVGLPFVWYNTSFSFYIGMFVANYEGIEMQKLNVPLVGVGACALVFGIITFARCFIPEMTSTLFSVLLAFWIAGSLYKFRVYNKIFQCIGSISWEFYLFQSTVLVIMGEIIPNNYIAYFAGSLIISMAMGYIIKKLLTLIINATAISKL